MQPPEARSGPGNQKLNALLLVSESVLTATAKRSHGPGSSRRYAALQGCLRVDEEQAYRTPGVRSRQHVPPNRTFYRRISGMTLDSIFRRCSPTVVPLHPSSSPISSYVTFRDLS